MEVSDEYWNRVDLDWLNKKVSDALQASLTLRARVELLSPGTLPRTEGKAKRVIDRRKGI